MDAINFWKSTLLPTSALLRDALIAYSTLLHLCCIEPERASAPFLRISQIWLLHKHHHSPALEIPALGSLGPGDKASERHFGPQCIEVPPQRGIHPSGNRPGLVIHPGDDGLTARLRERPGPHVNKGRALLPQPTKEAITKAQPKTKLQRGQRLVPEEKERNRKCRGQRSRRDEQRREKRKKFQLEQCELELGNKRGKITQSANTCTIHQKARRCQQGGNRKWSPKV
ncbi:unnamed protein product [Pleuronectes platessa]|uniref:Uncharacterized protein n=1 Tax=Pleuronectes platessa TaxID=8262 RepID=A0A9N7ZE10_PLEPL|nr:unnamed protein product [Pleuronectes platessa]